MTHTQATPVHTEARARCPHCNQPGSPVTDRPGIYECLDGDCYGIWEAVYETEPHQCIDCFVPGNRLEGYRCPAALYECPDCEDVWHVVDGWRYRGFPTSWDLDDFDTAFLEFNALYPPVEPEQLAVLLPYSARLVGDGDVDIEEDSIIHHIVFIDRDGFPMDVSWQAYKALTDAARQRFGHTPTRFSLVVRVMALERCIRDGTLAEWVVPNGTGKAPHIHPAVLDVFSCTSIYEMGEGNLVEKIRQVAREKYPEGVAL